MTLNVNTVFFYNSVTKGFTNYWITRPVACVSARLFLYHECRYSISIKEVYVPIIMIFIVYILYNQ